MPIHISPLLAAAVQLLIILGLGTLLFSNRETIARAIRDFDDWMRFGR